MTLDYIIKDKFFIYEINKRIQEDINFVKKAINLMPGINRLQSKINELTKKGIPRVHGKLSNVYDRQR